MSMPGTTGGHLCAPIWRDFMLKAVPIQQEENKAAANSAAQEQAAGPVEKPAKPEEKQKPGPKFGPSALDPTAQPPPNPTNGNGNPSQPATGEPGANPDGADINPANPPIQVPAPTATVPGAPAGTTAPPATKNDTTTPSRRVDRLLPTTSPRMAEPGGRLAVPTARRADPMDEMVTVNICADSHKRATQWCEITEEKRMRRRDIPSGRCRIHKAPPGEGDG